MCELELPSAVNKTHEKNIQEEIEYFNYMLLVIVAGAMLILLVATVMIYLTWRRLRRKPSDATYADVTRVNVNRMSMSEEPLIYSRGLPLKDIEPTYEEPTNGADGSTEPTYEEPINGADGRTPVVLLKPKEVGNAQWFENPTYKMDLNSFKYPKNTSENEYS